MNRVLKVFCLLLIIFFLVTYFSRYNQNSNILTEEAINYLNLNKTARRIYEDGQKHLGDMFVENYYGVDTVYEFKYILLCPDDLYWYGESVENNKPICITCVGSPEWKK